jgi:hypothetical protein
MKVTHTMHHRFLTASLAALCLSASPALAQIVYSQNFAYNGDTENRPAVTAYDWQLSFSNGTTGVASVTQSGFNAGTPTGAVSQSQSPSGAFDGGTTGLTYMYYGTVNTASAFMLFTSAAGPIDQNTGGLAFDWYYGTQSTSGNVRLAIEIGGDWYLSTNDFSSTTATASGDMQTQGSNANVVFDPAAANWADFTFNPGDAFTVASTVSARATDLPTGDITSFGYYSYNPNDGGYLGTSIDSVQVVPEPSMIALLMGLAVVPVLVLRRRLNR